MRRRRRIRSDHRRPEETGAGAVPRSVARRPAVLRRDLPERHPGRHLGPVRRRRAAAADRMRQRVEPAAVARQRAAARDDRSRRARRQPVAAGAAAARREPPPGDRRRRRSARRWPMPACRRFCRWCRPARFRTNRRSCSTATCWSSRWWCPRSPACSAASRRRCTVPDGIWRAGCARRAGVWPGARGRRACARGSSCSRWRWPSCSSRARACWCERSWRCSTSVSAFRRIAS